MLEKQAIKEFKQIYFEENGIELSDEEATEKALSVFNFFKVILSPVEPRGFDKNEEMVQYEN
jgi:hypothetical protein